MNRASNVSFRTGTLASALLGLVLIWPSAARAATVVEVPGYWASGLFDNTTGNADAGFLIDESGGSIAHPIGSNRVTYDFSALPIVDALGADFYAFEVGSGTAEHDEMNVLVSQDGINFIDITSTKGAPVAYALPGGIVPRLTNTPNYSNAAYNVGSFIKAYDLSGLDAGFQARYVRIQGVNPTGDGYDLNAVGAIHVVPEPQAWLLIVAGLGLVTWMARKRNTV